VKIHRVDQQPALQIFERDLSDQVVDQDFQWFSTVQGGSEESSEGDVGPGHLEDIPPANQAGPGFHLAARHPGGPRSGDQGADT
jgi:hypothetical protein